MERALIQAESRLPPVEKKKALDCGFQNTLCLKN